MAKPRLLEPQPPSPHWVPVGTFTSTALSRWLATYAIIQGAVILIAGSDRWASDVYETALSLPGAPESWGIALLLPGLLALYGSLTRRMTWTAVGQPLCGAWSLFFAITLTREAIQVPTAGTTGPVVYASLAVAFCLLAASSWNLRK